MRKGQHQRPHARRSIHGTRFKAGRGRGIGDYVTGAGFDAHAARELELFLMSDGDLYRRQYQPILANLTRKKYKGIYDRQKAVKLFMYLMDNGAKEYMRQYGKYEDAPKVFSKATKEYVARKFRDDFEIEFKSGAYSNFKQKYLK